MTRLHLSVVSQGAGLVVVLVVGLWLPLWSCAPPSTLPAPIPLSRSDGLELGGGAVVSTGLGEDCRLPDEVALDTGIMATPTCEPHVVTLPDIAHWGVLPITEQLAVGWNVSGGMGSPVFAGGAMGRYDLLAADRVLLGPQVEVGVAWASVGLPASMQVNDRLWVYTHPSVGFRIGGRARAPVGLSVEVGERMRLDMEAGLAVAMIRGTLTRYDAIDGPRAWMGVGLSSRLGR